MKLKNGKINVVAVDGYRLGWKSKVLDKNVNDFKVVIPGKTLSEVNKIISDSFDTIRISVAKNQALFEMENCKIVTRLLEGEFLDYEKVIPKAWETKIRANKKELQECFERVSLISMSSIEKERKYPVKVNIEIGKIVISCKNQAGDAKEEILLTTEGKNLEVGFNPKYFLDALKAIDDEEIFVEFGSSLSPSIVKSVEDTGDYVYMILPIRIQE
ncbi:MAG: DNA polymerase III subunit beta [Clostridia bacterium]|nr:DNA polymerase III subunit beta [Clostridia bacterium]